MNILIGKKLTSKNLPIIINDFWRKSFTENHISFDLSITEWITNSEILFLIGWINFLIEKGISVSVQLPKSTIEKKELNRRKRFQFKLLIDWNFINKINKGVKVLDGGITIKSTNYQSTNEIVKIPIIKYDTNSFDEHFYQLYNNDNIGLYKNYINLLNETNLSYLDSNFLNYSILKELYSNVCLHSNLDTINNCFYSFSINRKISAEKVNFYLLKERYSELSNLEKSYFSSGNKYRNINYVELNFQDFGTGIVNSLKSKYENDKNNLKSYFEKDYKNHITQNEDSRILQYAFLLFTSKNEIDKKFEIHNFIPRGLFIIKELAEKYQGYLEVFSGKGAISFSYKYGKEVISFANYKNTKNIFFGTRIRLVFPSKENIKYESVNSYVKSKQKPYKQNDSKLFINLLKEYTQIENISSTEKLTKFQIKILQISIFFETISKKIIAQKKNSIILIDFSGIDIDTKDLFTKFIYFITHSPSNTNYRIILFNVLVKNLNSAYIFNHNKDYKSIGFSPYPVPVIYPNLSVDWLGVDDLILNETLFDIWKGDTRKNRTTEDSIYKYSSSLIKILQIDGLFQIEIELPVFSEITKEIDSYISNFFLNEITKGEIEYESLMNSKHNYNTVLKKEKNVVYHNSYGNYQESYLTFNDKLYIKSYRRLIATYLIFKSINSEGDDNRITHSINKATKILSVTLSSQFLAFELQKIFIEFFNTSPEIIALSNYYNFHNERKFEDIKKGDKVIIINDIISTGRLTEAIFQSLERIEATPIFCLTIANLRDKTQSRFTYATISLTDYYINRFSTRPLDKKIIWINPILNSPSGLEKSKNDINTLMSKEEFLQFIENENILIGNMKSGSYYLTYYLDTNAILTNQDNFKLIRHLLQKLKEKKEKSNLSELNNVVNGLNIISSNIQGATKKKELESIKRKIQKLNRPSLFNEYELDLVFYPFQSNIQVIEKNKSIFNQININQKDVLIFPIPRIQTEKGWRFTFPPKFLNIVTSKKNQSVLILDDGSCTGSTIMQMIDSIAFLSIKSIDVLSIFGRLEDYQKELFSRLKSIKVKDKVVPLNIFFGVHYNLPVLTYKENPFLQEVIEIEKLEKKLKSTSPNFGAFLEKFKTQLNNVVYPKDLKSEFYLFKSVSKKTMMNFRDKIGLFDSYRFYSEDIPTSGDFDLFYNSEISTLTLLSVLNLEPHLYKTIKRLLTPDNISTIYNQIISFLSNSKYNNSKEKQFFLIKSLFYLNSTAILESQNLYNLIVNMHKNNFKDESYHYLTYLLFIISFEIRSIENVLTIKGLKSSLIEWFTKLKESENEIFEKVRYFSEEYRQYQLTKEGKTPEVINSYEILSDYYHKTINNEESHSDRLLPNQLNDLERIIINITIKYTNEDDIISEIKLKEFKSELEKYKNKYYQEYKTYIIIKNIIESLSKYGSSEFEFNPQILNEYRINFENSMKNDNLNVEYFKFFLSNLQLYRKNILYSDSLFSEFILNQFSNLEKVWNLCENEIKDSDYKKVIFKNKINYNVQVNNYILILAFKNLIKNKDKYAKSIHWEVEIKNIRDNRLDMIIIQNSKFVTGGDGTGLKSIKDFLKLNGTDYTRTNTDPYTLKIDFPFKK